MQFGRSLFPLLTSLSLFLTSSFLLLRWGWREEADQLLSLESLSTLFFLLASLLLSLKGILSIAGQRRSFSFPLPHGEVRLSLNALKSGVERFLEEKGVKAKLLSCLLKKRGKRIEITLKEREERLSEEALLKPLSQLLAHQFGYQGELEIIVRSSS